MTGPYDRSFIERIMRLAALAVCFWLAPSTAGGQVPYADSLDAILLTYKTLPPLSDLTAPVPDDMPDYRLIISPPFVISTAPETADKFYQLYHTLLDRTFSCMISGDRVAFLPTRNYPIFPAPVREVPGRIDTMHGLEVFQVEVLMGMDTLYLWNTDDLGVNFPIFRGLRGLTLYREIIQDQRRYRLLATRVERVRIPMTYVDPVRNQALYDFNAPPSLFEHSPDILAFPIMGLTGHQIKNFKGNTFPDRQPVALRKLQGKIVPLVFADYQMIDRLPDFLLTWLEAAGQEPDIRPLILTRTPVSDLRVILARDTVSARIPHLVIPDESYFSMVLRAPYAILLLDHGGIISFARNGLYIVDTEAISRAVEDLRTAWSKGSIH